MNSKEIWGEIYNHIENMSPSERKDAIRNIFTVEEMRTIFGTVTLYERKSLTTLADTKEKRKYGL